MQDITLGSAGSLASASLSDKHVVEAKALGKREGVENAAKDFERLLATMMIKELRSSLKDGFFPSGPGNDTYNSWLDESLGDALAASGDMGLAGQLKAQMGASKNDQAAGKDQEGVK